FSALRPTQRRPDFPETFLGGDQGGASYTNRCAERSDEQDEVMKGLTLNAFGAGLVLAATLVPGQVLAWQNHRESTTAVVTKDPQLLNKGPIAPPSFVHPRPLHRPFASRPFVHGGTVIYSAPPVYYAPPTYSYDPPVTY